MILHVPHASITCVVVFPCNMLTMSCVHIGVTSCATCSKQRELSFSLHLYKVCQCRLQFLFLYREGLPFPTPLLVHPPGETSYPWGSSFYPPGAIVNSGTCHFMQPNSLEFPPAQKWRTLDLTVAEWKSAMRESHQDELAMAIQAYVDVGHDMRLLVGQHELTAALHRCTWCYLTQIKYLHSGLHKCLHKF